MSEGSLGRSDDVSIDFSTEELVALCGLLGVGLPPGLAEATVDVLSPSPAIEAAATRSLIARHAVEPGDDEPRVVGPVTQLLLAATTPGLICRAEHETGGQVTIRVFTATPEVTVEHRELSPGVHRLTVYSAAELLLRVLDFCQLTTRAVPDVGGFEVAAGDLDRCRKRARAGDPSDALSALGAALADDPGARAFVDAERAEVSRCRVVIVHRPAEHIIEGGELAWIDGGEHGLWLLPDAYAELLASSDTDEVDEVASQLVTIEPTSATSIAEELHSYLPG
jgi:hypothetical protein